MTTAHMFWDGKLTEYQVASIMSFKKNGFDVMFWSFDGHELPDGTKSLNPKDVVDPDLIYGKHTYLHWRDADYPKEKAQRTCYSDLLRLRLLQEFGGWWFDCDMVSLTGPEWFEEMETGREVCVSYEYSDRLNQAAIAVPSQERLSQMLDIVYEEMAGTETKHEWGRWGPVLVTNFMHDNNMLDQVLPREAFYTVPGPESHKLWSLDKNDAEKCLEWTENVPAVHWYYDLWHSKTTVPLETYKGSFIYDLLTNVME